LEIGNSQCKKTYKNSFKAVSGLKTAQNRTAELTHDSQFCTNDFFLDVFGSETIALQSGQMREFRIKQIKCAYLDFGDCGQTLVLHRHQTAHFHHPILGRRLGGRLWGRCAVGVSWGAKPRQIDDPAALPSDAGKLNWG